MNDSSHLIYAIISLFLSFLAGLFGVIINRNKADDITSFIGSAIFMTTSIVHSYPRAQMLTDTEYPWYAIILIVVLIFLTCISFIPQSLNIIDDSFLMVTRSSIANSDKDEDGSQVTSSPVQTYDFLPHFVLYISMLFENIALGCVLSICDDLNNHFIVFLVIRFCESFAMWHHIRITRIKKLVYWIMVILFSVITPILMVCPIKGNVKVFSRMYGYSTSIVMGVMIFFGFRGINTSLNNDRLPTALGIFILLLTCALICGLRYVPQLTDFF